MVLIFHSFKGFSDLENVWDDLPDSLLKYNALDDFHRQSPMSLPFITDLSVLVFNQMVRIFHSFKDVEDFWDDLPVSRLKYNALGSLPDDFHEVFQTTSKKSSYEVFFHIK
uniref:Uncharacterized protein n=1 Tax=Brassica oleracea TaxID=3712 RepID=A0A3P6B0N4_BRAOL|nr:unnamed protein product [Brassica oleracea]